jgi:hypothetical protein
MKDVNRDDLKGSAHIQYRNTIKDMDPLEVLNVRLGHAPGSDIKKICKSNILTGLQYTYDDIKDPNESKYSQYLLHYHRKYINPSNTYKPIF